VSSAQALAWAGPVLFTLILLTAAGSDIARRKIPNAAVLSLMGVYALELALRLAPTAWGSGLAAAAIVFVVTYGLYHFNVFGAGDAKLFSAAALFAGLEHLAMLVVLTTLAGGLIAVGFLVFRPGRAIRAMSTRGRSERERGGKTGIPYGVAIAIGAVATALLTPEFYPGLR